ncbi:MAG: hypothetical protein FWE22_03760 [Firmicutes bacterium]|nr:hypothetical protein [Bacillota bacterium]
MKIIKTRFEYEWFFAFDILKLLRERSELKLDKVFISKLTELENYIASKAFLDNKGEVVDCYIVIEQEE